MGEQVQQQRWSVLKEIKSCHKLWFMCWWIGPSESAETYLFKWLFSKTSIFEKFQPEKTSSFSAFLSIFLLFAQLTITTYWTNRAHMHTLLSLFWRKSEMANHKSNAKTETKQKRLHMKSVLCNHGSFASNKQLWNRYQIAGYIAKPIHAINFHKSLSRLYTLLYYIFAVCS